MDPNHSIDLILFPPEESIIFENSLIHAALASYPISKGHTIVVWKNPVQDLGQLNSPDYEKLMEIVDKVRNALIETFKVKKVYLMYLDETRHVHWHLIPRYSIIGIALLKAKPKRIKTFPQTEKLRKILNNL